MRNLKVLAAILQQVQDERMGDFRMSGWGRRYPYRHSCPLSTVIPA